MLAEFDAMPTLATADLDTARRFYEDTLGFQPIPMGEGMGVAYQAGATRFLVYGSAYAGTNQATSMAVDVPVERFPAEVEALRAAGIVFDTFELEGVEWNEGVATMQGEQSVWFRDPDGNILAVSCST
jgi:catechol 2,3-dioxygenase-like lactoylglutathione lyase family enzyme